LVPESTRDNILKWLITTDPSGYHNSICTLREEHTGTWLNRLPDYNAWKEGRTRVIWFHGIPGAGKTVLFSRIVDDIKAYCSTQTNKGTVYIYYYCYFGRNQDESGHLIRWAIGQLVRRAEYVPTVVYQAFEHGEELALPAMMTALSELCGRFTKVYLLVDALDESLQRPNLLQVVGQLNTDRFKSLKILTTSREESDIKLAMNKIAKSVSLSNPYIDEDIATYVRSQLAENSRLRAYPPEIKHEIEIALVKGARGM
jgi:hypothetical protein